MCESLIFGPCENSSLTKMTLMSSVIQPFEGYHAAEIQSGCAELCNHYPSNF